MAARIFKIANRSFSATYTVCKNVPCNTKGKGVSSHQWISRQISDPYIEKAKMMNYRCRSAFKLIEIDDKARLLKPGQVVIDCGASPGSWTQVAVNRVNADGKREGPIGSVIAVDKLQMYPVEGAEILGNLDFTREETQEKIRNILQARPVDVVVSDMAPSASGIKFMDHDRIISLCYSVLKFAVKISVIDGTLLVKLWDGGGTKKLENDIGKFYKNVRIIKPSASRSDSAEIFLLAKEFKGLKR